MDKQPFLKKGYTTGVHASFAFASALKTFLEVNSFARSFSTKMDNDDLDVTKGCEIIVSISNDIDDLTLNRVKQTPQIFKYNSNELKLFAGEGVGVVTKKGLKIEPNFPAINPAPLFSMIEVFKNLTDKKENLKLFCTISVVNGEKIAKQTANEKVGIFGGISILGTTGFVKPVSNRAYLDSIKSEIVFAKENGYEQLVLTIGNSSFEEAKKDYNQESIIEIGNFVYDAFFLAYKAGFQKIVLICGIGKLVKISQGCKNTHNRFGSIDFKSIKKYINSKFDLDIDTDSIKSIKGIVDYLSLIDASYKDIFYKQILYDANCVLKGWFDLDIVIKVTDNHRFIPL